MILWDIYEITSVTQSITGVKCRGRLRKRAVELGVDLLVENATDVDGCVRFALISGTAVDEIRAYIHELFDDAVVECIEEEVMNPVLSKLKVNNPDRYE